MTDRIEKRIERIEILLRHSLAVQLYLAGCNMKEIGKHLRVAKSEVVKMLKGIKNAK